MEHLDRIRVVLAEIPPMLSDIVRETVANETDMAVVAEFGERSALLAALATNGGDVVIFGTSDPDESAVPCNLLGASPRVKVLMLEIKGLRAVIYELRPHKKSLGDVSPQRLVQAIRWRRHGEER